MWKTEDLMISLQFGI